MSRTVWSSGGAILAGGESRRMGHDKAMLAWRGEPLWQRQRRVLREFGAAPVTIVRRRGQTQLGGNGPLLYDAIEGGGPLAGLHAALLACRTHLLAVLAVDMPQIDAAWFRWLRSFCRPGVGAVVYIPTGFEPLAAIYPREALGAVTSHLRSGDRSLQHLVTALVRTRQLVAVPLPASEWRRLMNWNTPHDETGKTAVSAKGSSHFSPDA